ncbi:MAG TPA: ABC transporter permease [Bacillota bacterium]|nr:ABC transporter permease [Candidatus Fermentithermobacillaceae bacterium]HOB30269.1 ABC transporter permease [Bacillota bacterium]HOK64122.1 ABC transporter permease [Bacillota bacterium]HOL11631.1 ABC transporter permease [Bacillota bacterium]HOQ02759.1 ABC transporter permease [Bacillota bacterium]
MSKGLFPLHSLIAKRRIRYTPFFAVFVLCAVTVSVATSFLVTTIIATNVELFSAQVKESVMPFDGIMLFANQEELDAFMTPENRMSIGRLDWTTTYYMEVESTIGPLKLLGNGVDLESDTIEFLYPWTPSQRKDTQDWEIKAWALGGSGPSTKFAWNNVICKYEDESIPCTLYGWASVNPSLIADVKGSKPCIILTQKEQAPAHHISLFSFEPSTKDLFAAVEQHSPRVTKVITPLSGKTSLASATKGAFSYWHVASLLVLLGAAVAITCVLTVSFLGRKRPLGIMRVLGATVSDITRMMSVEAAYMGTPGIVLGVFAGRYLAGFLQQGSVLPWSAYAVSITTGLLTLIAGVYLPVRMIKNANCQQLLNDRPVYVVSNPSCEECGLCGGI